SVCCATSPDLPASFEVCAWPCPEPVVKSVPPPFQFFLLQFALRSAHPFDYAHGQSLGACKCFFSSYTGLNLSSGDLHTISKKRMLSNSIFTYIAILLISQNS
ncbi:MAG: hypothetical protein LAT76_11525, partial [Schleiferiaceae bacterium]|nr:hypothetical protein [Schleiferiaceae bacterium]